MDTDFWVVMTTHGPYRVDEDTANYVRFQIAELAGKVGQENRELEFKDLADSRVFIVVGTYLGVVESTKEQRAWDRKMNAALDAEKGEDDPEWLRG